MKSREIYLVVLVVALLVVLYFRLGDLLLGSSPTVVDLALFVVLIALALSPHFREINLLGVISLKKEIDDLKTEVKEQLVSIRATIQSQSVHIYNSPPPAKPKASETSENAEIEEDSR